MNQRVRQIDLGDVDPSAGSHDAEPTGREAGARISGLVRYLTVAYTVLIAHSSLYPFSEWVPFDGALIDFVAAPWPRYYSVADLVLNVLGYMPFGFLLALLILPYASASAAATVATLAGTCTSFAMELLQQFIVTRVASNLDLLANGVGAMVGSMIAVTVGGRWLLGGRLYRWRQRVFLRHRLTDLGFVMLALWMFTQLNPDVWLFGNGEVHPLIPASFEVAFAPDAYRWLETGVTACNLAAIALLVRALARDGRTVLGPMLILVLCALVAKAAGAVAFYKPGTATLWVTPGCLLGIPLGVLGYAAASWMSRRRIAIISGLYLAAGIVLINIAPENPYLAASVRTWQHGHFLSFSGLTHVVSAMWPFVVLIYLARLAQVAPRQ